MRKHIIDRLMEKTKVDADTGCWEWTGGKAGNGYGNIWYNGKLTYTHRLSYELFTGEIPAGLFILHKCDNPACINPDHLWAGTAKENSIDCVQKGRDNPPHHIGEKNGRAKLSSSQVLEIRKDKRTHHKLAEIYGVSYGLIGHIKARRCWKHLS